MWMRLIQTRYEEDQLERMGQVIRIRPEAIAEYKRVHKSVWPEVLVSIRASKIRNYSIYLMEPENIMFSYWEYYGDDYEADMEKMFADPKVQEWTRLCGPMQAPLGTRKPGEWWARMDEVFHLD
jgi:L-rhamnose mutarotase